MKSEEREVIILKEQMKQINQELTRISTLIDKRFDRVDVKFQEVKEQIASLDKKFATKEELKNVKASTRLYKNGALFVSGAVVLYLVGYIFDKVFNII